MPIKLKKSLQNYLSKIKKQTTHLHFPHKSFSSTTSKILKSCKYPRGFSFKGEHKGKRECDRGQDHDQDQDQDHQKIDDNAATLEDIDRFLFENFKSLYGQNHDNDDNGKFRFTHDDDDDDEEDEEEGQDHNHHHGSIFGQGAVFESPRFFTPPPDLCGSHRFFVSPASTSSSSIGARGQNSPAIPKGMEDCIAVLKVVAPCPHEEFRRSMTEVMEGRIYNSQRVDWNFMEELLFCHLKMNEKKQYRYILSAFVDLIVALRQNPTHSETEALDRENKYGINKGKGRRDL